MTATAEPPRRNKPPSRTIPAALRGVPDPPAYISDAERDAWRRFGDILEPMGVVSRADFAAFEALCFAYVQGQRIRAMIRRTRNDDGTWMFLTYNPMRFTDRSLRRWLLYFGLTRRQLYHVYDELRFRPDRDAPWPVEEKRHG